MGSLRPVAIRVPGKLLISGEYAVLGGAPAIVTCVDRYCDASAVPADEYVVTVTGPESFTDGYRMIEGRVEWASGATSRARDMLGALLCAFPPVAPLALTIDSSAFYAADRKLGLGSSAAVAVATGTVLAGASGHADALHRIEAAHHAFQGGLGSGADVYAIALGGCVQFERTSDAVKYRAVRWPEGLHALPVSAANAASTIDRVTRFQHWLDDARGTQPVDTLAADAAQVATAWRSGDVNGVLSALSAFTTTMLQIDSLAGLDYTDGGHAQLLPVAEQCGVVYKPCGAGGGDFGVALSASASALDAFAAEAGKLGFDLPDMGLTNNAPTLRSV
ncbi:MAG: hypothetical protein AAF004_05615 [Pseudomonadota bacterium]